MVPTTFLLWHLDYCSVLKRPSHTLLPALKADVCTEKSCSLPLLHCKQILLTAEPPGKPCPSHSDLFCLWGGVDLLVQVCAQFSPTFPWKPLQVLTAMPSGSLTSLIINLNSYNHTIPNFSSNAFRKIQAVLKAQKSPTLQVCEHLCLLTACTLHTCLN